MFLSTISLCVSLYLGYTVAEEVVKSQSNQDVEPSGLGKLTTSLCAINDIIDPVAPEPD